MFVIEETSTDNPMGDKRWVIDHERDVRLQRIFGGPGPVVTFLLGWQGREIAFEASETWPDNRTLQWNISRFGEVPGTRLISTVPRKAELFHSYHFSGVDERQQALLLAAEGMICFGTMYSGSAMFERGYSVTVLADGRIYSRFDFV